MGRRLKSKKRFLALGSGGLGDSGVVLHWESWKSIMGLCVCGKDAGWRKMLSSSPQLGETVSMATTSFYKDGCSFLPARWGCSDLLWGGPLVASHLRGDEYGVPHIWSLSRFGWTAILANRSPDHFLNNISGSTSFELINIYQVIHLV